MSRSKPATSSRTSGDDERGSVSIELVVLLPALLTLIFLGVQAALIDRAQSVALAAAQEGARAASAETGSSSDGLNIATQFVAEAGGDDFLIDATVSSDRGASAAIVTVRGRSLSVIPGWRPTITQHASRPIERATAP
jgi:Flp pilus assembly protein TadG